MSPYYLNPNIDGLISANSEGDGYSITLSWATAYPLKPTNRILYNLYMGSDKAPDFPSDFFQRAPSFLSINGSTKATIVDLLPGQMYHFAVRAAEYNPSTFDPTTLPVAFNGLVVLPESLLAADITATDTTIPLISTDLFPASGTVKIGAELVFYSGINSLTNSLIVPGGGSGSSAALVDQGGGHFYTANPGNIGSGTINSLQLVSANTFTQTWTIKCIEVLRDGSNNPIPGTARFAAIGSISGAKIGGQDTYFWIDNGVINSNTILSFSITETTPFHEGDFFIVKVAGSVPGVGSGRGFNGTVATLHRTDGYDGSVFQNPNVIFWPVENEEQNTRVFQCWNRFDVDHFAFTITDGYRQKIKDILTTDLSASDAANVGFPSFDFAGYHRTDPVLLLSGACVGSYIGGAQGCIDGYSGSFQLRGLNIQDQNQQRQEVLLDTTGEPVVLVRRRWTGITCDCMLPYNEYPSARCTKCFGGGIVITYEQFFNPRRSDGRIMVRFDPTVDDLLATDSGLESTLNPNAWTLGFSTIKDRDFIVRFDTNSGAEEYRYEILNVTRNKLLLDQTGAQKFSAQRIRKTDIIYTVPVQYDVSTMPRIIYTTMNGSIGIPNHQHTLVVSEQITSISQINQTTSVIVGHNHAVLNGVMEDNGLGHFHQLLFP